MQCFMFYANSLSLRRFFPAVMINVRGLNPRSEYVISLKVASTDGYRYKFYGHRWVAVGESEILQNEARQVFRHPSSPNTGDFWMTKPISFKSVKITHNPSSKNGNVSPWLHEHENMSLMLCVQSLTNCTLFCCRYWCTLCTSILWNYWCSLWV